VTSITKDTAVSIGLIIALSGAIWGLSGDRARAMIRIEQNEKRIAAIEVKIDRVYEGVHRIEVELGTLPDALVKHTEKR
jgi:hypothetical protein